MQELREQLRQLCSVRPPPPAPPNIDYQTLVSAFMAAMQQQASQLPLQQQQFIVSAPPQADPSLSPPQHNAPQDLETSMAQGSSDPLLDTTTLPDKSFDHDAQN
ncbi:hypothetical protein ACA910_019907 [Epithemia clementina (nom. ined.)]